MVGGARIHATGNWQMEAMNSSESISVVIPCYNAAAWITATLRSVFAQGWSALEVIVVDDGSTDESVARVKREFPQVRVLQQQNAGVAAARNAGILAAEGHWIAFVDADDHWLPGKLQAQMELLRSRPDARMAYTAWATWESLDAEPSSSMLDAVRQQETDLTKWDGPSGWIYPELLLGCSVWTSTVIAHKDLLRELGGFDRALKVGEDYDLWLRTSRMTPILRVKRPLALYRLHPSSLTKQTPVANYEAAVVERALMRWGYTGPDGRSADVKAVAQSLARTWNAFGAANLKAGCTKSAWGSARKALELDRWHGGSWKLAIKAVAMAAWRGPWRPRQF